MTDRESWCYCPAAAGRRHIPTADCPKRAIYPDRNVGRSVATDEAPEVRYVYAACEVRGPNLVIARRCKVCGALATVDPDDGLHRVMGRLPETCRYEHGNETVSIPVEVPDA
jgi:hypothetical protein